MMKHAFPDVQGHIEDIFAAGDKVAVRLRIRGTHRGEFLGIPATGRTVEYVSHEFYRIADGSSPKNGSAPTWPPCSASSADYPSGQTPPVTAPGPSMAAVTGRNST